MPPSILRSTTFWQYSKQDLEMVVRLKIGHQQAILHQEYENLLLTAQAVFGKKRDAIEPGSAEEAERMLRGLGVMAHG